MSDLEPLSERELAILRGFADGQTYAEVASGLYISADTVRSQLKKTYAKLGVSTQAAAVAAGFRHGLIS